VTSTRRVQFTHAECNFYIQDDVETQKCDNDTHDCDLNSHKSDLYTQSVMLTRISVIMTRMSVILTLTKVIMTHIRDKTTLCRPQIAHAGHMIRRPEDLPQIALFRAKPNGRRNQRRPKSRWAGGVNSDSLALGARDWTHCAQDRQSWKDLLEHSLTKYWL
jgi:hypothetical protein